MKSGPGQLEPQKLLYWAFLGKRKTYSWEEENIPGEGKYSWEKEQYSGEKERYSCEKENIPGNRKNTPWEKKIFLGNGKYSWEKEENLGKRKTKIHWGPYKALKGLIITDL